MKYLTLSGEEAMNAKTGDLVNFGNRQVFKIGSITGNKATIWYDDVELIHVFTGRKTSRTRSILLNATAATDENAKRCWQCGAFGDDEHIETSTIRRPARSFEAQFCKAKNCRDTWLKETVL